MTDKGCRVVYAIAGEWKTPAAAACAACHASDPPNDRNRVTCGLAIGVLLRSGKPLDRVATEFVTTYKPPRQDHGPGAELEKLLAWFAEPSTACPCKQHAAQMNRWGVEGCRQNLETITRWLLEAAAARGWPSGKLSRFMARQLILQALKNAKRNVDR